MRGTKTVWEPLPLLGKAVAKKPSSGNGNFLLDYSKILK
jgi:hypothetical protein